MDKTPLISIITINFNDKDGLQRTFDSVFEQDFQDFEYIVIDGGSQDGSKELIEKNADKISYWISEPDKGIYNAMNKGIKAAKGEYLFFLNAGDLFINDLSLKTAAKHVHTEDIIYFNIQVEGKNLSFVKECPSILNFYFFYQNTLPHQATFMSASSFKTIGLYDESFKIISDWKWYLEAICFKELSYKKIEEKFSIFFLDGLSSTEDGNLDIERKKVLSKLPKAFLNDAAEIEKLKNEIKTLQHFKNSFFHLKKYKLVKLLHQLKLIKIPE